MNLTVDHLTLAHGHRVVVHDVSFTVEAGEMVAILGPNGSGKSTLLRGMARLHPPRAGRVLLDGRDIRAMNSRHVARVLAILPQAPAGGLDLTVRELAFRGRYPHQGLLQRVTRRDIDAVEWALDATDSLHLADRPLAALSGGERQRAWIAMALAQEPRILLLDEPTTFLDVAHQVEVMHLLRRLNARGITIVAVLHDLALAGRFTSRIIALREGRLAFDGPPSAVLQPEALERVFGVPMLVLADPDTGLPIPIPRPDPALCPAAPTPAPAQARPGAG
ncbi:ABC transporter ATP-binding protein [Tepidiforma bonchosmolovskayae]|jgi:iron complex transport system ATP-binding protein|uniref:ABC transporter ATP-binding protein n=1 Tax=Tepidiforma bonchosmolovskayae TaxID=2601677 RepID=A0ABX6BZR9_9CHLR|nr:ABC transporter ATP-binding protein [Tepidiforma bonchosmolovskayae]QFG02504.1 ABC transporter ATP-binding protein [Tepidiforma bonchosmolovskayae]